MSLVSCSFVAPGLRSGDAAVWSSRHTWHGVCRKWCLLASPPALDCSSVGPCPRNPQSQGFLLCVSHLCNNTSNPDERWFSHLLCRQNLKRVRTALGRQDGNVWGPHRQAVPNKAEALLQASEGKTGPGKSVLGALESSWPS